MKKKEVNQDLPSLATINVGSSFLTVKSVNGSVLILFPGLIVKEVFVPVTQQLRTILLINIKQ